MQQRRQVRQRIIPGVRSNSVPDAVADTSPANTSPVTCTWSAALARRTPAMQAGAIFTELPAQLERFVSRDGVRHQTQWLLHDLSAREVQPRKSQRQRWPIMHAVPGRYVQSHQRRFTRVRSWGNSSGRGSPLQDLSWRQVLSHRLVYVYRLR